MNHTLRQRHLPVLGCLLLVAALLTACGGSDGESSPTPPVNETENQLHRIKSAEALDTYIKNGLRKAVQSAGVLNTRPTPARDSATGSPVGSSADSAVTSPGAGENSGTGTFSTTNLIEQGVDESDIVKFDGTHIFVAEQAHPRFVSGGCREICTATDMLPTKDTNQVRIARVDDMTHTTIPVATLDIPQTAEDDYQNIAGLMLHNQQLITLSNATRHEQQDKDWAHIWSWGAGRLLIDTFNVANPAAISHQHHITLDGYLVDSRRIDNTLYVVTRFTPDMPLQGSPQAQLATIDQLSAEQLLPHASVDGSSVRLVEPENCYVDAKDTGYPTLMVATAINLTDNSLRSACVTADMSSLYVSKNALYLLQATWSAENKEQTHIYKFALTEEGPLYRGEGQVAASLAANEAFSISEHDGVLRLATQHWDNTGSRWSMTNQLHTFRDDGAGTLTRLATLPNDAHPEAIGKPGETIQGVRFVGDRAYVVTFRQTDPLYVIDLSDPTSPFIAGQVEIPGFSTLLQPLGHDLLLGIGREDNHLKAELYDVSNPAAPQAIGKQIMATTARGFTGSEAQWNHHALALLQTSDTLTRVSLPFFRQDEAKTGHIEATQGAWSFMIDSTTRSLAPIAEATAPTDESYFEERRVLLHGNTLHYLHGTNIWSSAWGSDALVANPP